MQEFSPRLIVILCISVYTLQGADGDATAEFETLNQRHCKAASSATVDTIQSVEDTWYQELKKLRLDALGKSDNQTAKKIEAMLLSAGKNGVKLSSEVVTSENTLKARDNVPLQGSRWDGSSELYSTVSSQKTIYSVEGKITSVDKNTFVLRTESASGAIWDWTFKLEGQNLTLINFARIQTAKNLSEVNPAIGITGSGHIENGSLTFRSTWPQAGRISIREFELKLVE